MSELAQCESIGERKLLPNPDNFQTQNRLRFKRKLNNFCKANNYDEGDVSLDIVKENQGDIEKYVITQGEIPSQDPIELSIQAYLLREAQIRSVMEGAGVDYDEALVLIEEDEAEKMEAGHPDSDNFLGAIFSAIGGVAKKAVQKAAEKRAAQGKNAGFFGNLNEAINKQSYDEVKAAVSQDPALAKQAMSSQGLSDSSRIYLQEIIDKVKEEEKKKEIKKMIPLIIVGVLVIIAITVLLTRKR